MLESQVDQIAVQIVVVIPAHNERAHLPMSLRAMVTAAMCVPVPVQIVVVLDACTDGSEELAGDFGSDVHFVSIDAGNVGAARAAGFAYARSLRPDTARTWYATSDADTAVPADWLVEMTTTAAEFDADMVLGGVRVGGRDFSESNDHVHGANMGFRSDAYWSVGGFRALKTSEDAELAERFEAHGMSVHRDGDLSVETSARRSGRAPDGFADYLRELARTPVPTELGAPA
ncbi:glycosyltransferase [Mycolicibacterium goodii]|uniref:4,4'-diaponeurosporenoate glycosyltransferase n=1 Tax=Mycolicibacterium goodii TaxID=134601 RepID=A0A0K0XHG7_MYCGD|nr:glycosyl transferase [Mycolicibacterium goodii]